VFEHLDVLQEVFGVDRLLQEGEVVTFSPLLQQLIARKGREQKNPAFRERLSCLDGQVDSGELRHHDVADQQVGGDGLHPFERLQWIRETGNVEALATQNEAEGSGDEFFIVDNKDCGNVACKHAVNQTFRAMGSWEKLPGRGKSFPATR